MVTEVWVVADVMLDGETVVGEIELYASEVDASRRAEELGGISHWPETVR